MNGFNTVELYDEGVWIFDVLLEGVLFFGVELFRRDVDLE